jgi:membrane associated rhomboid family serine protease
MLFTPIALLGMQGDRAGMILPGVLGTAGCLLLALLRRPNPIEIVFDEDEAIVPRPGRRADLRVRYQDLRGVHVVRSSWMSHVVIALPDRAPVVVSTREFATREMPDLFVAEVRRRIGAMQDGAGRLREFDLREASYFARAATARWVIPALCVATAAGFALQVALGAVGDPEMSAALGGTLSFRLGGGLHRLVTANLLHAGWLHLLSNVAGLLMLRALVERWLNAWRLWIVVAVSAVAGNASAAVLPPDLITVGASTVSFGLLGAFLALCVVHRKELAHALAMPGRLALAAVLYIAIVAGGGAWEGGSVDHAAHAGGLLGGMLAFAWVTRGATLAELKGPPNLRVRWTALALALAFLLALAVGGLHAWRDVPALLAARAAQG